MNESLAPDGLPNTGTYLRLTERGMKVITLPAGDRRYVNVLPALLVQAEVAQGNPTICVRDADNVYSVYAANHVEVLGPSETVHSPENPLPCSGAGPTAGRAYNSTEAAIRCYVEERFLPSEERVTRRGQYSRARPIHALPHFFDALPEGGPGFAVMMGDKSARDAIAEHRRREGENASVDA